MANFPLDNLMPAQLLEGELTPPPAPPISSLPRIPKVTQAPVAAAATATEDDPMDQGQELEEPSSQASLFVSDPDQSEMYRMATSAAGVAAASGVRGVRGGRGRGRGGRGRGRGGFFKQNQSVTTCACQSLTEPLSKLILQQQLMADSLARIERRFDELPAVTRDVSRLSIRRPSYDTRTEERSRSPIRSSVYAPPQWSAPRPQLLLQKNGHPVSCLFCAANHHTNGCPLYATAAARINCLQTQRRCVRCLQVGCQGLCAQVACTKCNTYGHHFIICPSFYK